MKRLLMLGLLMAIAALPVSAQPAPNGPKVNPPPPVNKGKPVPEPSTILLLGAAAAGFAGVRKLLRAKGR
jgi:PEP-CTERM motif